MRVRLFMSIKALLSSVRFDAAQIKAIDLPICRIMVGRSYTTRAHLWTADFCGTMLYQYSAANAPQSCPAM